MDKIYGMSGNVREWYWGRYGKYSEQAMKDYKGVVINNGSRAIRGRVLGFEINFVGWQIMTPRMLKTTALNFELQGIWNRF